MKNIAITKEVQDTLTPSSVLDDLMNGNNRFTSINSNQVLKSIHRILHILHT